MALSMEFLILMTSIIILDVIMRIVSIVDIYKPHRGVKHLSKSVWTIIVILINFAWIIYLLVGRDYESIED